MRKSVLLPILLCVLTLLSGNSQLIAQCYNWSTSATLTAASTCAANGTAVVSISGPDATNLSSVQYGIPIGANGFSVPLNATTTFANMPPGTYTVSAVGICGGTYVGRNTTVTVPGSYQLPGLSLGGYNTLTCLNTGKLWPNVTGGTPPFTYLITGHPAAYTGPLSVTTSTRPYSFTNMPQGTYTVKVIDACLNGTAPATFTINSIIPSLQSYGLLQPYGKGCDTLGLWAPQVSWYNDDSFTVSMQVSGGILAPTPFMPVRTANYVFRLPSGMTFKDCYGKVVTYTIQPPCGPPVVKTITITGPSVFFIASQNCLLNFKVRVSPATTVCLPITYTLTDSATNVSYGPFTYSGGTSAQPTLPFGNYTYNVAYTTGDGATGTTKFKSVSSTANPYSVAVLSGAQGLHNYIGGFAFTAGIGASQSATVDLFSGPAGYSYHGQWSNTNSTHYASRNGLPAPTTLLFPAGNYVWKITDGCGAYYVPVTVGPADLYQFTVGPPALVQTCFGLKVTPTGSATHNGATANVGFSMLLDGMPYYISTGGSPIWPVYALGSSFSLTVPGTYTIIPTSASIALSLAGYYPSGGFSIGYPNMYMPSYTFTYSTDSPSVDMRRTQGFLCKGGAPGSGQIFATGKGGIPFTVPTLHYNFDLANAGFGLGGPYIASNSTGIFTNIGANANSLYDLRLTDSCGAFTVQKIRILALDSTRLISSSQYVACQYDSVRLSALYLPNATYSWTGPGGFTSSQREPMIYPTIPAQVGIYRVSVTTAQCSGTYKDSTVLTMNPAPPKPMVTYACMPRPIAITVTNPSSGFLYQWDVGLLNFTNTGIQYIHYGLLPSDTLFTKYTYAPPSSYNAVAVDTITGCRTYSDTLFFFSQPHAVISATHQDICPGDTTTLIAGGKGSTPQPSYQWFRNGTAIPGATGGTYSTTLVGSYRVRIEADICNVDTSPVFVVKLIPQPIVALTALPGVICDGVPVTLQTPPDTAYTYTWIWNGATIPGVATSSYQTAMTGTYSVVVANSGCVAVSAPLTINAGTSFNLQPILPNDTLICNPTNSMVASVSATLQGVRWSTGDTTAGIRITVPGLYWVEAHNACGTLHDTLNVHFCKPVIGDLTPGNDSICVGDCTQPSASITNYPLHYQWLFEGGIPASSTDALPGLICYSKAGTYPVTLIVGNGGGSDTMTATIVVSAKPVPRFEDTALTVSYKNIVNLPACAEAHTADWYLDDSLICAGCPTLRLEARYYYNTYRCVVRNGDCADSCSYVLRVVDIPNDLWLPDAFTPNGDGRNDVFRIITDNPNIQVVNLDVFNRWGNRVFTSNLNNVGWDGKVRGVESASGTYFWQLRYRVKGSLEKTYSRQGDLLLIR